MPLRVLADFFDDPEPGWQTLFFSPEYRDFQRNYMDDVLSSEAFAPFVAGTEHPELVKGYLSTFRQMFDAWRKNPERGSLDEFVEYAAGLFEHGIRG